MASLEAGTSHAKLDVAFFGWVWLIVESGNIFFVCETFSVLNLACGGLRVRVVLSVLCVALFFLSALLFVSALKLLFLSFSPHWALQLCRELLFLSFNYAELLRGNNILHIFILHAQVIKMGSHHLHTTSSLIGSLFCSYCSNLCCEDFSMEKL